MYVKSTDLNYARSATYIESTFIGNKIKVRPFSYPNIMVSPLAVMEFLHLALGHVFEAGWWLQESRGGRKGSMYMLNAAILMRADGTAVHLKLSISE